MCKITSVGGLRRKGCGSGCLSHCIDGIDAANIVLGNREKVPLGTGSHSPIADRAPSLRREPMSVLLAARPPRRCGTDPSVNQVSSSSCERTHRSRWWNRSCWNGFACWSAPAIPNTAALVLFWGCCHLCTRSKALMHFLTLLQCDLSFLFTGCSLSNKMRCKGCCLFLSCFKVSVKTLFPNFCILKTCLSTVAKWCVWFMFERWARYCSQVSQLRLLGARHQAVAAAVPSLTPGSLLAGAGCCWFLKQGVQIGYFTFSLASTVLRK